MPGLKTTYLYMFFTHRICHLLQVEQNCEWDSWAHVSSGFNFIEGDFITIHSEGVACKRWPIIRQAKYSSLFYEGWATSCLSEFMVRQSEVEKWRQGWPVHIYVLFSPLLWYHFCVSVLLLYYLLQHFKAFSVLADHLFLFIVGRFFSPS